MPDGKHCPACGRDIGYWAVARGMFRVRCPHCRVSLNHRLDSRMSAITTVAAVGAVAVAIVPGFLAGELAFRLAGGVAAVAAGAVVWVGVAFGLGFVIQVAATPVLRRTQRLVVKGEPDTPAEEESW